MTNYSEEVWELIARRKEQERAQEQSKVDELQYLLSLPFHKRIQHPKMKEQLDGFKARQKEAFAKRLKKDKVESSKLEPLFDEFFKKYLDGKVSSISEFFK